MRLTSNDIKNFQRLYMSHFGVELSKDQAKTKLALLVRQMQVVYQPITSEQFKELLTRDEHEQRAPKADK